MIVSRPTVDGKPIGRLVMSGIMVMKYECQRCPRVWYEDLQTTTITESSKPAPPCLSVHFTPDSTDIRWDVLCDSCVKTVGNYVKALVKDLKNKPRGRKAKVVGGGDAPSVQTEQKGPTGAVVGSGTRGRPSSAP